MKVQKNTKNTDTLEQENIATIFCRIPYAGVEREKLITNLVRKLKRHIDETFKLKNIDCWKKLNYSCVPEYLKSQIKYEFCPACNKYIGKTFKSTVVQTKGQRFTIICWNANILIMW